MTAAILDLLPATEHRLPESVTSFYEWFDLILIIDNFHNPVIFSAIIIYFKIVVSLSLIHISTPSSYSNTDYNTQRIMIDWMMEELYWLLDLENLSTR